MGAAGCGEKRGSPPWRCWSLCGGCQELLYLVWQGLAQKRAQRRGKASGEALGSRRGSLGHGAGMRMQRQEGLWLVVGRGGVVADGVSIHGVLRLSGERGELGARFQERHEMEGSKQAI